MFAHSRIVAVAVVRIWGRDLARVLGSSTRSISVLVAVSVILAASMGLMLALIASSQISAEIPPELRASVVRTSFAGATLTAGAIGIILCLSLPQRTALQNLFDLLPIGRAAARIGQLLPLLMAGAIYSVCISSTSIFILTRSSPDVASVLWGLFGYALLISVALALSVSIFGLLQSGGSALLKLPPQYNATVAGVAGLSAVLAVSVPDILATTSPPDARWSWHQLLPSRALAATVTSPSVGTVILSLAWVVVAAALIFVSAQLHRPEGKQRQPRLLHGASPARLTPFWGRTWMELLTAVRNPQFITTTIVLPLAVAAVWLLTRTPVGAMLVPSLASAIVVFPFMLSMYSVGRTLPFDWVTKLSTRSLHVWVLAKPLGCLLAYAALAVPTAVALLALGMLSGPELPSVGARCLLATAIALTVGSVVPYSEQQPMSVVSAGFIVAVVYVMISMGLASVTQQLSPAVGALITVGVAASAFGVYALVAQRLSRREPARA